jgi:molybdopterin molybdotransferase
MVIALEHRQRITRLTPLDDVRRRIALSVAAVAPRELAPAAALGAALAQDIAAGGPRPSQSLALIDGWAVESDRTAFAEAYAPALLPAQREIAVGEVLSAGADAVAPLDAVLWHRGKGELATPVAAGDGVLMPGTDAAAGELLWRAGHRLRAGDIAVLQALGIRAATVRKPRICIARAHGGGDDIVEAIVSFVACAIAAEGGEPLTSAADVEAVLTGKAADGVIVTGGTGSGPRDGSVDALRRTGVVEAHGIAISPGETAAFGTTGSRPALLIPGRLDAAVAVWLLIGRPLMARLCGVETTAPSCRSVLTTKVTSTVGVTELVPVCRTGDGVRPVAAKYLPLATLAHADGWIVIPAASEGLAPGATVTVTCLP